MKNGKQLSMSNLKSIVQSLVREIDKTPFFLFFIILILISMSSCRVILKEIYIGTLQTIGRTQERSMEDREPKYSARKEGKLNGLVGQLLFCVSNGDTSYFLNNYNHYVQFKQLNNKSNLRKSYGIVFWESILKSKDSIFSHELADSSRILIKGRNRYKEYSTDSTANSYDIFWDGSILNVKKPFDGEQQIGLFLNNPSTRYNQYKYSQDTISFEWVVHGNKIYHENYTFRVLSCEEVRAKKWHNIQAEYCKDK